MTIPHLFFVVLINFIWGSMFIVATLALYDFPPVFFTALRFTMLTVLLVWYLRVPRNLIVPLIRIGLVMGVGMYLTLYLSLHLAENTASIALFSKLEVPFVLILGVIVLKEYIGPRRIAGVTIAFLGAAIIGFDPAAVDDIPALIAITASSALYALSMIMVRQLDEVNALSITAWVSLVSFPILMAVSLAFESNHIQVVETAGWDSWLGLVYTVVMGSIVAHTGMYWLLQRYPVAQIAPFNLLSPVFAVAGGILILDDAITTQFVLGGLMVLAGVGWIYLRSGRTKT